MRTDYQIEELSRGFGFQILRSQVYRPGVAAAVAQSRAPRQTEPLTPPAPIEKDFSQVDRLSLLNTPIFSELRFGEVTYTQRRNGLDETISLAFFNPIDLALFTVSQQKNIVTTKINGRNGSVKEYMSDDDYKITIQGGIFGPNGKYPKEEVQNLLAFLRAPVSLEIFSPFLELFEIFAVDVDGYNFPQQEGRQSQQLFEIYCSSSTPVELIL